MEPVTTENVMSMDFGDMVKFCFSLVRGHEDRLTLEPEVFVSRLGEYAALYQYFSELYAFMIGKVREASELSDAWRKARAMDKRDCLEQVLKAIKFNYDALSRKTTILSMEERE